MTQIYVPKNIPGMEFLSQDLFPGTEISPQTEGYGGQLAHSKETVFSTFIPIASTLDSSCLSSSASFFTDGGDMPPTPTTRESMRTTMNGSAISTISLILASRLPPRFGSGQDDTFKSIKKQQQKQKIYNEKTFTVMFYWPIYSIEYLYNKFWKFIR